MKKKKRYKVKDGKSVHRVIYEKNFGKIPIGFHVHHIDCDSHNNKPENLIALSEYHHVRLHQILKISRIVMTKHQIENWLKTEKRFGAS